MDSELVACVAQNILFELPMKPLNSGGSRSNQITSVCWVVSCPDAIFGSNDVAHKDVRKGIISDFCQPEPRLSALMRLRAGVGFCVGNHRFQ